MVLVTFSPANLLWDRSTDIIMTNQSNSSWTARLLATFALLALFIAPATAFADKQVTIRAELDSSLTKSQRISYADQQFNDYNSDGLTGIIHIDDSTQYLTLEGPASNIDTELTELESNWRTTTVTTLSETYSPTWSFNDLSSHTEDDTYNKYEADSFSNLKRQTLRAKFSDGTDTQAFVQTVGNEIGEDGLGGVMIVGPGSEWIEMELEGDPTYVDYWTKKFYTDSDLTDVVLVNSDSNVSSRLYDYLWTHTNGDAQRP